MGFVQEFKEFAVKGNVMDLAVGVIVGGAFGAIVNSAIGDLVMPLIGRALGRVDFADLFIPLAEVPAGTASTLAAVKAAGVPVFAYGSFLTVVVNFALLAWIVFLMVKGMNALRRQGPAAAAAPPEDVVLLREIRDSLKARG